MILDWRSTIEIKYEAFTSILKAASAVDVSHKYYLQRKPFGSRNKKLIEEGWKIVSPPPTNPIHVS